MLLHRIATLGCALLLLATAPSAISAAFEPIWARDGMVVTSVRPAAAAGAEVLRKGGNAVDAAVATAFAAAVAHPFSSGLGGGMFAVTHTADGEATALDARETAPAAIDPEIYRKDQSKIKNGPLAVGVPGFVQGVHALHQRYGTMPWADLIEPAIALAEEGVQASFWHRRVVTRVHSRLANFPETARIQLDEGRIPELGWTLVQKDLANTLRHIQKHGARALAEGEYARKIAEATGGAISEKDLGEYQVRWRTPLRGSYRGYQIVSMPPPSSGGVLLVGMLNMLETMDLQALGHGSSRYVHMMAEVMRLAFADRARYLGDPDFYDVPVERLISRQYALDRVKKIRPRSLVSIPELKQTPDDQGTTHISVMDSQGNAVAITQTINGIFGSLITVPGTGIVLNNELDDFSIQPNTPNLWEAVGAEANAIVPGKRPLSSMTPTIVLKDGQPHMVLGSPMGTMIISSVLHALVNVVDHGMDPQDAVMAPRFHHQWKPDLLFHEPEFPMDVQEKLLDIGHKLNRRSAMGAVQMIQFDAEQCYFLGGVDGRRDSGAAAVNLEGNSGRRAACLAKAAAASP
ncbi:MAG: gamma-glutamyltransferase [Xanthomonadales bacterium]|nr:gamma-glutamyltransferase [Xanthomonadales bacterium]